MGTMRPTGAPAAGVGEGDGWDRRAGGSLVAQHPGEAVRVQSLHGGTEPPHAVVSVRLVALGKFKLMNWQVKLSLIPNPNHLFSMYPMKKLTQLDLKICNDEYLISLRFQIFSVGILKKH